MGISGDKKDKQKGVPSNMVNQLYNNFLTRAIKDLISAYKWVFKGLSKEFPMPFEHYSPPINHYKFSINDHYYDEFTREIWDKIIKEGLSVVNKNEHWIWINK